MLKTRLTAVSCVSAAVLLAGCNKSYDTPSRFNKPLGGEAMAVPTGMTVSDPGIIKDQTAYMPANPGGVGGPMFSGNERQQIETFRDKLYEAYEQGDAIVLLDMFNPDQVALWSDNSDKLFARCDMHEAVYEAITRKGQTAVVGNIKDSMRDELTSNDTIDPLDADNGTVSPNVVAGILGPMAGPVMRVLRVGGEWKVNLEAPLGENEVAEIEAFNARVQEALSALVELIDEDKMTEGREIEAAFKDALRGIAPAGAETLGGGEPEAPNPDAPKEGDPDPTRTGGEQPKADGDPKKKDDDGKGKKDDSKGKDDKDTKEEDRPPEITP